MGVNKLDYAHMAKVFGEKAEVFRGYSEKFGWGVRMSKGHVDTEPTCGTVACVGGWLAHHYQTKVWGMDTSYSRHLYRYYLDGVGAFTQELGFTDVDGLRRWANDHPELWGNTRGYDMFYSPQAYGALGDSLTLLTVASHWSKVAYNLHMTARVEGRNLPDSSTTTVSTVQIGGDAELINNTIEKQKEVIEQQKKDIAKLEISLDSLANTITHLEHDHSRITHLYEVCEEERKKLLDGIILAAASRPIPPPTIGEGVLANVKPAPEEITPEDEERTKRINQVLKRRSTP